MYAIQFELTSNPCAVATTLPAENDSIVNVYELALAGSVLALICPELPGPPADRKYLLSLYPRVITKSSKVNDVPCATFKAVTAAEEIFGLDSI